MVTQIIFSSIESNLRNIMKKQTSGLVLLHHDAKYLAEKYPDNQFLFGLYEVTSALHYWSMGRVGHWMLFYMMNPDWRQTY